MGRRLRTVLGKELRENLRDRRVILSVFISPLLVTPALIIALTFFSRQHEQFEKEEVLPVGVVDGAALPELVNVLHGNETLEVSAVETRAAAEQAVRERRIRAVLVLPEESRRILESGRTLTVQIVYDRSDGKSHTARQRLLDGVGKYKDIVVAHRLREHALQPAILEPVRTEDRDVATEKRAGGFMLGFILPYVVILGAAFGGMTSAFDTCAGEKERGTMETLLVSPASRTEIILGKLATIAVISLVSAACSILGLLPLVHGTFALGSLVGEELAISYVSVALLLPVVLPIAVMTSALLLLISTVARNQKEAQAYVFPFIFITLLPAILSILYGPENHPGLSFVPLLNIALVMKQVLTATYDPLFITLAVGTSTAYAAAMVWLTVSLFQRESILFRT